MLLRFRTDNWMGKIFFSDETYFHIGGYVNKQNFRFERLCFSDAFDMGATSFI